MIGLVIVSVLLLSCLLGLLVLGVVLLWHSPSQIHLYLRFTLFGSLAALCMLVLMEVTGVAVLVTPVDVPMANDPPESNFT